MRTPYSGHVIWGTQFGTGFVSQKGVFTATHAGQETITATVGTEVARFMVIISPGIPSLVRPEY